MTQDTVLISRRRLLSASAAGLATAVTGCQDRPAATPQPAGAAPVPAHPGGLLRWSQPAAIDHLDPHTSAYGGGFVASLLYDTLFRPRRTADPAPLEPEPHLAASMEQPEATVVLLRLQPGARFHDLAPVLGRPVLAEDVVFSLRRITGGRPEFIRRQSLAALQEVQAVDDATVRLRLDAPYAPLTAQLSTPWPAIVPRELVELQGDLQRTAIGSGPYALDSYQDGSVEVVRNAAWWRRSDDGSALPNIDRIALSPETRPERRLDRLLQGGADWAPFVPFERAGELTDAYATAQYPLADFQHVRMVVRRTSLRDVRVRRALSLALDRRGIVARAFGGRGEPHGVLPPSVKPWALSPDRLPYYQEQARGLLEAAGFEQEMRLVNLAPQNVPLQNAYTEAVREQWAAVGVRVSDREVAYADYLAQVRELNFDVNVHWGERYDEVDGYLAELETGNPRNFGGWGNEEVDGLIQQQRRELDSSARRALVDQVQRAAAEQGWLIGVASWLNTDAWTVRLKETAASVSPFAQTRWLAESWLA